MCARGRLATIFVDVARDVDNCGAERRNDTERERKWEARGGKNI